MFDHGIERIDRAEDRDTVDFPADARGRVGENPDDPVNRTRVAPHLANEHVGPVLGADQEDRHALVLDAFEDVVETAILEQPIGQARPAEQRDQHEPVDQQNRSRKRLEPR